MGILISCCRSSTTEIEYLTPSLETKRRQQAEAAEKRLREQESRGIRDPERLKAKTHRMEQLEKRQDAAKTQINQTPNLTWTVG